MLIKIKGMSCNHCVNRVKKAFESLGASNVEVNLQKGEATFDNLDYNVAKECIEDLGFIVE